MVNALVYLATIQGHYWLLRSDSEEQRRNYLSTLHYDDYKIGDGHGNIDGRQGIRLGEPGVKVLSVFEEAVTAQEQKIARELMAKQPEPTLAVVKASKTGYSMLKPKQATAQRILMIMHERGQRHHDEILSLLADTSRLYEQMELMLAPLAEEFGTSTPLETLKAVVDAEQQRDVKPSITAHLQERWGATLEEVDMLFTQATEQGEEKPVDNQ